MRDKLEQILRRAADLEKAVSDPEALLSAEHRKALMQEYGAVRKVALVAGKYLATQERIRQTHALLEEEPDAELQELAREELAALEKDAEGLFHRLLGHLAAQDPTLDRDVIVEIRAGTGGDEAALFAADLFRMYRGYCEKNGWKVELLGASPTELGGFKEIVFAVKGEEVFRTLRFEMGGHRVQRVPATEAQGRIHTSAATVAVMAEAEEVDVDLKDTDLKIDFYRASGPGGQNVNKTSSAVRITHLPTGIVVQCQDDSSQHKNRARAMRHLRARIFERKQEEQKAQRDAERRSQIGSGDRSQRIRTYNFPQDRITDHRIGLSLHGIQKFLEGNIQPMIDALLEHEKAEFLKRQGF
ncbi:MAG: peptide chain release factor 1 [Planctomycetes bacterium]|nr:peptide chain release factor 1 [Planctomycetota bacterium]